MFQYRWAKKFLMAEAFEALLRDYVASCAEGTLVGILTGLRCLCWEL